MTGSALIDTGAILALLDKNDRWHAVCAQTFSEIRLPLVTSEAVLTELFHLVGDSRRELQTAWGFVRSGVVTLATIENLELAAIQQLMLRYWDRPMDFADASLVYLASREKLTTVFTVDRADFETYRINGKRRFRILPAFEPDAKP